MRRSEIVLLFVLTVLAVAVVLEISLCIETQEQTNGSAAPVLSADSGFYEAPFTLSITAPEGSQIYYTVDGSLPTTDSILYTHPITITWGGGRESDTTIVKNMKLDWLNGDGEEHSNVATIIRAVAVDKAGDVSDDVVATYFFGQETFRDKLVISIVADPDDLFGDKGIYVTGKEYDEWYLGDRLGEVPTPNFLQHGEDWERPAVIELFDEGVSILQQSAGIRIQGASARDGSNKRFSVYARKKYSGSNWFDVPLFGDKLTHSFVLRSHSSFMNGYIMHLVQDRAVESAESREVIVYLNGAMWYITIAQEKYSEKYFQEKYGVDDDNVVIVKAGVAESGQPEDQALYQAIYDFVNSHDISDVTSYEQLDQIMDIQSYIDFSCINVYFANLDYSEYKNFICWRAREKGYGDYEDGRWRWALYDMDLENGDYGVRIEEINTFTMDTHYAGAAFNTRPLYVALRQNELFCRQFVLSFMDMVNTDFTVERAAEAMKSWKITPQWWGMSDDWVESYFLARTEAVTVYLAEEFGLTGTREALHLSVNDGEAGYIVLNTITPDLSDGEWSGSYFTDYPVTVTAMANDDYVFVGWQIGDTVGEFLKEKEVSIEIPIGGLAMQAVFEKK